MKQVLITVVFLITVTSQISSRETDTIRINTSSENNAPPKSAFLNAPYTRLIIPAVFISYGAFAQNQHCLKQLNLRIHQEASKHFTGKLHADDYIQYVPAIAVYGLDFAGVKAKHNIRDRTFLIASSYLFSSACVQTLKRTTHVRRPDDANDLSFPSGHTATAFVGAHLLFKEYKNTSPWIGIAGYTVATGTGAMRILNKRHWFSDVVAGAGFGILSVEISYFLLPVFHNLIGVNDKQTSLTIAPQINIHHYGVGLACTF